MPHIAWKKEYSVNVPLIDQQHQHILELLDEVFDAIKSTKVDEKIGDIIERIVEHAVTHFATEEHYFDEFGYVDADDHKERHRELIGKAMQFQKRYMMGETNIAGEMVEFLEGWLIGHIMEADKKYMQCFAEHGL